MTYVLQLLCYSDNIRPTLNSKQNKDLKHSWLNATNRYHFTLAHFTILNAEPVFLQPQFLMRTNEISKLC